MVNEARILIVDDDENIRRVLAAILEDKGYRIDTAGTASDAIKRTQTEFFNLALIDIRLPDMEGIDLLGRIKETTPRMRKIVITGYPTLQNAVEAVNRGADAYIMKPFDVERVLTIIGEQLKKQEQDKKYSQDRVAEFIETKVRELDTEQTCQNQSTPQ